ncbi:hypothetical protein [Methylobacterium marchantiae]|uniref:DUF3037 domain-containing protein n=1 Tax=Methylobacterium marchantiae TaxID=600331 RepID=A0ABW3X502_9HYPH|nr:hypothetical protein AIGOOFII_3651 [Methylobacterium marchantiae]
MPAKDTVHFSYVEYRPNPARPEGAIPLGLVIEFVRSDAWVVGLAMRSEVPKSLLGGMDLLSRELADSRIQLMREEVGKARELAKNPGDVLRFLAEANPWSLHVKPPCEFQADANEKYDNFTIEKIAEKYVLELYARKLALPAADVASEHQHAPSYSVIGHAPVVMPETNLYADQSRHADVPPAWMLPPTVWINPRSGSGR